MIGRPAGAMRVALVLAMTALLLPFGASAASGAVAKPKVHTSLTAVEGNYMCVLCHEPLAVAQSAEADDERELIQHLVVEGDTAAQIQTVMVAQYSAAVLSEPPAHGFNLLIYILPPAVLLLGVALLIYTLPRWRARGRLAASTPYTAEGDLNDADAKRLDADLASFD